MSLAGGRGGLLGPMIAVVILSLLRTDMTFLRLNTNLATVGAGRHPRRGRHARHVPDVAEEGRMTGAADAVTRNRWLTAAGWRALFRDRPVIPLIVLLGILVVISELVRPGVVNAGWAGVMLRTAVPLAILGGAQTLAMLTGGIDLSVGAVASMSGFVVATLVGGQGLGVAILVALVAAALAGTRHRHRRGRSSGSIR